MKALAKPDYLSDLLDKYVEKRRVCIQAGGHNGRWAEYLSEYFDKVITFEPEEESFALLAQRVPWNVFPIRAALWKSRGVIGFKVEGNARKKSRVVEGKSILCLTIDDIAPQGVDFLCIDIEGSEAPALEGAMETINSQRPVISIEVHPKVTGHGEAPAVLPEWYRYVDTYGVDQVYVPDHR